MKKIGLNALLLTPRLGGVGVYIRELIRHRQLCTHNSYNIIVSRQTKDWLELDGSDIVPVDFYSSNPIKRIIKENRGWPRTIKQQNIDLFHSPISYIPSGVDIPSIVTIHDLRYFHFPETYTKLRGAFLKFKIPQSLKKAAAIIAVSHSTKNDILDIFDIDPEKITVIHEGLDAAHFSACFDEVTIASMKNKFNLNSPYILSVGHLEPRKNYERLFRAFQQMIEQGKTEHKLVIVGQENWHVKKIYDAIGNSDLSDRIMFSGFVSEDELVMLYQNADVFVSASIFEGFGFTPLEAMAAKTPVCVSNATSHPEVCGDAALYFDPYDIDEMASKLNILVSDNSVRNQVIASGIQNIKRFDWKKSCTQTFGLYEKVANEI